MPDEEAKTAEKTPLPFIHLTLEDGKWKMESNLSQGQAKWSICEMAAILLTELRPG